MYEDTYDLAETLATQEGVKFGYKPNDSYVEIFAGSTPASSGCARVCSERPLIFKAILVTKPASVSEVIGASTAMCR